METSENNTQGEQREMLRKGATDLLRVKDFNGDRQETLEIPGKGESGEVIHYGDIHGSIGEQSEKAQIKYQKEAYNDLQRQKPDIIVLEGYPKGEVKLDEGMVKFAAVDSDDSWRICGGYLKYALQNNVKIYGTEGEEHFNNDIKTNPDEHYISTIRENYATHAIRDILKDNPKSKIALAFGGIHNFKNNFEQSFGKENMPTLKHVVFPKIATEYAQGMSNDAKLDDLQSAIKGLKDVQGWPG